MEIAFSPFRAVGAYRRFQPWVRALQGASGVYIIRAVAGTILYIGESHTGRLYEPLPRHFQDWNGQTAGPSYHRGRVEAAVALVPAEHAVAVQNALIASHAPEDNRRIAPVDIVNEGGEEVPF